MFFTFAITHYNRFDLLMKSFPSLINDERVNDILIMDDASTDGSLEKILKEFEGNNKVRIIRNVTNQGMSRNKSIAVGYSYNPFVILFDSDNIIETKYLDAIDKIKIFQSDTIYSPARAWPVFNYDELAGKTIDRGNVKKFMDFPQFGAMINTCNYVCHRDFYLKNYNYNPEIKGTDTAWHFYNHLKNGGKFHIVPDLEYFHLVHKDSTFMEHADYNMAWAERINQMLREL